MSDYEFTPAFGNRPSKLVGRDRELSLILNGLDARPGSKERAVVLLGQRGYGKTVPLWEIADRARERGFVVATHEAMTKLQTSKATSAVNRPRG